jgi:predicted TPR repeat methyltransferase
MEKQKGYYSNFRSDLLKLIPANCTKILDVGCGEGLLGAKLKEFRNDIDLYGVEMFDLAAEKAEGRYTKIFRGDVEKIDISNYKNYFDCIIYGDVLEHLIDPWQLLKKHRESLNDCGFVIASIPNVQYYKIIFDLIMGKWTYQNQGIMDQTHLRFFTKESIKNMYSFAGYDILNISGNLCGWKTTFINKITLGFFERFFIVQYLVVAQKKK